MTVALLLDEPQINELLKKNNDILVEQILGEFKNPFPEIMTIDQVCKYLQYSRPTILKFIKEQNFPVSRRCESMRFFKTDVDNWMKEKKED